MSNSPHGVLHGVQCRRSNRKATAIPIWLRNEELGPVWEEETETQIVSRCGAGLSCRHLASVDSVVVIVRRDTGRRAKARVRYSRYNPDGRRELGVEFIDTMTSGVLIGIPQNPVISSQNKRKQDRLNFTFRID